MIAHLWRRKPWRNPLGRGIRRLDRCLEARAERREHFFEALGRRQVAKPVGRCLIAYTSEFIRLLYRHPGVGPNGWHPERLAESIQTLAGSFSTHAMFWESAELVRQVISRGFIVDYVSSRHEHLVRDPGKYDVIIDEWNSLPEWKSVNPRAKTLFYATGAHWLFHNVAGLSRYAWLFQRRAVALKPRRQVPPLLSSGCADLISCLGNPTCRATFGADSPRVRKLWVSVLDETVDLAPKDWGAARRSFLYFAGVGWVHKGLDLVVEAFLKEPDLHLTVVGGMPRYGIDRDADFRMVYGREIERARNIEVRGFLDVCSPEFRELMASCCAVICPSASESGPSAVVQCLHYGLIPLVTPVGGLEVEHAWRPLSGTTDLELIDEIRARCRALAEMSGARLEEYRRFFWEYARKCHTRSSYSESLRRLLDELLGPGPVSQPDGEVAALTEGCS